MKGFSDEELEKALRSKKAMCRLYPWILKRYMVIQNREKFDVFIAKVLEEVQGKDERIKSLEGEVARAVPLKAKVAELQREVDALKKKYDVVARELQFRARHETYSIAG
jgi:hypothetical protein